MIMIEIIKRNKGNMLWKNLNIQKMKMNNIFAYTYLNIQNRSNMLIY